MQDDQFIQITILVKQQIKVAKHQIKCFCDASYTDILTKQFTCERNTDLNEQSPIFFIVH